MTKKKRPVQSSTLIQLKESVNGSRIEKDRTQLLRILLIYLHLSHQMLFVCFVFIIAP